MGRVVDEGLFWKKYNQGGQTFVKWSEQLYKHRELGLWEQSLGVEDRESESFPEQVPEQMYYLRPYYSEYFTRFL